MVLGITLAYLALSLVVGLWPARSSSVTTEGFVAGDRGLGLVVMYFITGATVFSAFAFLGGPGWAYSRGTAAFYILAYGAVGFAPFWFLGPRAARLGRKFGFVTQAEMVAARFGNRWLGAAMALVSVVAFVPYLAIQMKGAGYVLATVSEGAIPEEAGAALVYSVVLIYVLYSGVLGVGWTNTFQGIFMMALAWGLGLYLPYALYGGVGEMFSRIAVERPELLQPYGLGYAGDPWPQSEYASTIVVSAVGFSMWPHLFMKAFTAKSTRTIRRTVILYPTFQIFLIPLFLIGFAGVLYADAPAKPDQILPHLLMGMGLPSVVVGLFCAGALAASMSSGDAMAHAAASIAVRDGFTGVMGRRMAPMAELRAIRVMLVVLMAAAYAVTVGYQGSLVTMLLTTYGAIVQFAPVVVAALYLRRVSGAAALTGLVVGSAVATVFTTWPQMRPWAVHAGLYGLIANIVMMALITAFSKTEVGVAYLEAARVGEA